MESTNKAGCKALMYPNKTAGTEKATVAVKQIQFRLQRIPSGDFLLIDS